MSTSLRLPGCVLAVLLVLAVLWPYPPASALIDANGMYNEITSTVETPHVKWAKPLAGGPLKALVVAPRYGMRDLVELGQRLDLTWTAVPTAHYGAWGADERFEGISEADALARLDEALKHNYDLIILGNVQWKILPKPKLYELFRKVRDGAGMVYVPFEKTPALFGQLFDPAPQTANAKWITDGAAEAGIACLEDVDPVEFCGVLGKGRVAIVCWPGGGGGRHSLTSPRATTWMDYEYGQQVLVRACLWAAGRVPRSPLALQLPEQIARDALPGLRVEIAPPRWGMAVRDTEGVVEHVAGPVVPPLVVPLSGGPFAPPPRNVKGSPEGGTTNLPILKLGGHFVDVWAYEGDRVVDFASHYFTVTGDVDIGEISFDKPFVEVGDEVTATVKLTGEGKRPANAHVSVFDLHGQEVARQVVALAADASEFVFTLRPTRTLATKQRVRVRLSDRSDPSDQSGVITEKWTDLLVPTRGHPDLEIIGWASSGSSWLHQQLAWVNRRAGLTASMFSGNLDAGIRAVPYSTHFSYSGQERVSSPCYTNPADRAKIAEKLRKDATTYLPYGALAYGLGDENSLAVSYVEVCLSPTCQADFRAYVKREYVTLQALNAEWGTKYTAWDEIVPMDRKQAEARGNLAPWLDHRLHMDEVFAGIHAFGQKTIQEIDPHTPAGPEGLWGTHALQGYHWYRFAKELGLLNVYTDEYLKREIIRSLAPREALTGMWYGSYVHDMESPDRMQRLPWMMLLHDQNSIWYFGVQSYSHLGSALVGWAPDWRPMPWLERTLPEWQTLHRGAAKLLMSLDRMHDGIAVLYSRPSCYAFGLGTEDMLAALEDAGYQYDIIPDQDLTKAPPDLDEYEVLILPNCRALSEAEVANIGAFCEAGGVVIADMLPGLYDGHAKKRGRGALNDLFGLANMTDVVRQEETSAKYGDLTMPIRRSGECEPGAGEPEGALADGRPAVVSATHGIGTAVYLNYTLEGYRQQRTQEELPASARLLGDLLVDRGIAKPVTIVGAEGKLLPRCEICRYTDGTIQLVGILREVGDGPLEAKAQVQLPAKGHVYDVRRHRYLGETATLNTTVGPVEVLAILPYRLDDIEVKCSQAASAGTEVTVTASVQTKGRPAGKHVLRFAPVSPSGKASPLAQNVVAGGGKARWTWRVPFNAEPGTWVVCVIDAATGTVAQSRVAVRPL